MWIDQDDGVRQHFQHSAEYLPNQTKSLAMTICRQLSSSPPALPSAYVYTDLSAEDSSLETDWSKIVLILHSRRCRHRPCKAVFLYQ